MAQIDSINNGDSGSVIRTILNSVITFVNSLKTRVTENASYNLLFGNGAGNNVAPGEGVEEGTGNTFVGYEAGRDTTNGGRNTAFGAETLQSNIQGTRNTAFGTLALQNHIVGNYNVAYGYQTMGFSKVGVFNTAYGYKALRANIGGYENTALGYKTLEIMNGTGGQITAFTDLGGGQVRVTSAAHGQSNGTDVFIKGTGAYVDKLWNDNYDGTYTISNVTVNTFDITATYVAESSLISFGYWFIDGEGSRNTAVGDSAGSTLRTGSYNTILGYVTNVDDPDGDYQLAIHLGLIKGYRRADIRQNYVQLNGRLRLDAMTDAPYGATAGDIYFNSTDNHFYGYNGSAWVQLDN